MACNEFNPCTDCGCEETVTPALQTIVCDEPSEPCEEGITASCIISVESIPLIGVTAGDDLNTVIEKLVGYLENL